MKPIYTLLFIFLVVCLGCTPNSAPLNQWEAYDETEELAANADHPIARMRYKRIQSKHSDRNALFLPFKKELSGFNQEDHDALKSYILEQDIPSIQKHINAGHLTYEELTLFYIYRMYRFELGAAFERLVNLSQLPQLFQ
jgi:amidase